MTHGLQNRIVELNWARNEQCGVIWLARHLGLLCSSLGTRTKLSCLCGKVGAGQSLDGIRSVDGNWWPRIQVSRDHREPGVGRGSSHFVYGGVDPREDEGCQRVDVGAPFLPDWPASWNRALRSFDCIAGWLQMRLVELVWKYILEMASAFALFLRPPSSEIALRHVQLACSISHVARKSPFSQSSSPFRAASSICVANSVWPVLQTKTQVGRLA